MAFYIIIVLLLLLGVISRQSKQIYGIGLAMLFLLSAFRDPRLGGSDAGIYQRFFAEVPTIGEMRGYQSKYTVGYTLFNSLVKTVSSDYRVFQFVYALLVIVLLYFIIRELELKDSEKCLFLLSFFCYRFIWDVWVSLRQNIANMIFWLLLILLYKALKKVRDKGEMVSACDRRRALVLAVLTAVLPALFHTSAWANIVLLPLLLLFGKINRRMKTIAVVLLSVFLYLFGKSIFGHLLDIMVRVDSRYTMYESTDVGSMNAVNFVFRLAFFLLFAWRYEAEKHELKNMILDSLAFMVLIGSINAELITRMYEFYAIGLYGSMGLFLHNFKGKGRIVAAIIFTFALLIIMYRFALITDNGLYMNYSFGL